jgi:hypothetical protein
VISPPANPRGLNGLGIQPFVNALTCRFPGRYAAIEKFMRIFEFLC